MSAIGQYVFTLICGSLICGVILSIGSPEGTGYSLRKMLCGLFLVFLAISPLKKINFRDFTQEFREYSQEAEAAAAMGQSQAEAAILDIIKARSESYILDKAAELDVTLEVQVEVEEETYLPVSAELEGEVTPYEKQVLSDYITQELGIEKEAQNWNRH